MELVLVGGVGALALVALALSKYEAVAALGFVLIGVVRVEPAPADLIFATLIVVGATTGRLRFNQLPPIIAILLSLYVAVNLVSFIDAVNTGRAVQFFLITVYLIAFSAWLTTYATSYRRV
jgi:hypothetical protein